MLTDYHVHLRPDDPGTAAAERTSPPPTPSATARPRPSAASPSSASPSTSTASPPRSTSGSTRSGAQSAVDDLDAYVAFVREETDLRLGIEADFIAGREDRMANLLDAHEWDYVIGSVHFLGDFAVDFDDETDIWRHETTAERVWKRYFEALAESALTGMFDIIAHPDLVKIWGSARPAPSQGPALLLRARDRGDARRRAWRWRSPPPGCASRSARSTRRGRCSRWRSTRACRSRCRATPTAPSTSRYGYEDGGRAAADCGVKEIAVFERRARRMEPLG